MIRVDDRDRWVCHEISRPNYARSQPLHGHGLRLQAVKPENHTLDVEHDIDHVLHHAVDARKLVRYTFDLDRGDRRSLQAGYQNAPKRISNRRSETLLERLDDKPAIRVRAGIFILEDTAW